MWNPNQMSVCAELLTSANQISMCRWFNVWSSSRLIFLKKPSAFLLPFFMPLKIKNTSNVKMMEVQQMATFHAYYFWYGFLAYITGFFLKLAVTTIVVITSGLKIIEKRGHGGSFSYIVHWIEIIYQILLSVIPHWLHLDLGGLLLLMSYSSVIERRS